MPKLIDLTGQKFTRLAVLERADNIGNFVAWRCVCDCGNEAVVTANSLRRGHTRSCGCLHSEVFSGIARANKTHGLSASRIYKAWSAMKDRCQNTHSKAYNDYGGRGISVCKEWQDFAPFYHWALETGYSDNLTIDRVDVNGNYCPENCRWVDMKTQSNNKRNNKLIAIGGETHTISEWSDISGIKRGTIGNRLRKGWSPKRAVFSELLRKRRL